MVKPQSYAARELSQRYVSRSEIVVLTSVKVVDFFHTASDKFVVLTLGFSMIKRRIVTPFQVKSPLIKNNMKTSFC
jgi:hypothetical protein